MASIAAHVAKRVNEGAKPGILFVRKRADAKELASLIAVHLGFEVPFVTGDVPELERGELANGLRTGALPLVVSTAVWSRGIDIPGLRWVGLCEGQAPIGVVQGAGRAGRMAAGKELFEVWNFTGRGSEKRRARLLEEGLSSPGLMNPVIEESACQSTAPSLQIWQVMILLFIAFGIVIKGLTQLGWQ